MKNLTPQLALSTIGVLAILAVGLFSVNCVPADRPCYNQQLDGRFNTSYVLTTPVLIPAGKSFEKTISINIGSEFKKRYSVDLDGLNEYYVTLAQASFTSDRCSDLESYEISVTFPQLGPVTEQNKCVFPEFQTVPDALGIGPIAVYFSTEFPGTNPTAQQALRTNFAPNFKNYESITANVKFTAKNDIPVGFGIKLYLESFMKYSKCI